MFRSCPSAHPSSPWQLGQPGPLQKGHPIRCVLFVHHRVLPAHRPPWQFWVPPSTLTTIKKGPPRWPPHPLLRYPPFMLCVMHCITIIEPVCGALSFAFSTASCQSRSNTQLYSRACLKSIPVVPSKKSARAQPGPRWLTMCRRHGLKLPQFFCDRGCCCCWSCSIYVLRDHCCVAHITPSFRALALHPSIQSLHPTRRGPVIGGLLLTSPQSCPSGHGVVCRAFVCIPTGLVLTSKPVAAITERWQ